jgi:hypothetical protein
MFEIGDMVQYYEIPKGATTSDVGYITDIVTTYGRYGTVRYCVAWFGSTIRPTAFYTYGVDELVKVENHV